MNQSDLKAYRAETCAVSFYDGGTQGVVFDQNALVKN